MSSASASSPRLSTPQGFVAVAVQAWALARAVRMLRGFDGQKTHVLEHEDKRRCRRAARTVQDAVVAVRRQPRAPAAAQGLQRTRPIIALDGLVDVARVVVRFCATGCLLLNTVFVGFGRTLGKETAAAQRRQWHRASAAWHENPEGVPAQRCGSAAFTALQRSLCVGAGRQLLLPGVPPSAVEGCASGVRPVVACLSRLSDSIRLARASKRY